MKLNCLFLIAIFALHAQNVEAPLAGIVVDQQGRIMLLHGVMQNLLPPEYPALPPLLTGQVILSAAFNASGGVLKMQSQLALLDSQANVLSVQTAPSGNALFSFSPDGTPAWVWYPANSELLNLWSGASINTTEAVVALGPADAISVQLLTISGAQLWGGAQLPIQGASPAAFFQGGWLTSSETGLLWTPLSGGLPTQQVTLLGPVQSIQTAGQSAVVINGRWLLNARFQLLEIPGASRPARKMKAY